MLDKKKHVYGFICKMATNFKCFTYFTYIVPLCVCVMLQIQCKTSHRLMFGKLFREAVEP